MNDIEGIRKWWTENKIMWKKKWVKINTTEQSISSMKDQQMRYRIAESRGEYGHYLGAERDCWAPQIEAQQEQIRELKVWFVNNRLLVKRVWGRFQELEEEARSLRGSRDQIIRMRQLLILRTSISRTLSRRIGTEIQRKESSGGLRVSSRT
jgi:hypothetical protein